MYAGDVRFGRLGWSHGHPIYIRETVLALACLLLLGAGLRQYDEFILIGTVLSLDATVKMIHMYY